MLLQKAHLNFVQSVQMPWLLSDDGTLSLGHFACVS